MSVSQVKGNANRRQDVDRRQSSQSVAVDRRAQPDRRTEATAASNGSSAQGVTATTRVSAPQQVDRTSVSTDDQGDTGGGFGSFLKSFEGNFDEGQANGNSGAANIVGSGGGSSSAGSPFAGVETSASVRGQVDATPSAGGPDNRATAPKQQERQLSPEEKRRDSLESTGKTLQNYTDFTTGEDGFTTKGDYQAIAEGKRNEEFGNYLKEKHPDWSQEQLDKEVKGLQDSSRVLTQDQSAFDFYDNATNGGATDGKISAQDIASGRLRNDISKDYPPQLSVDETNKLHEMNPALGNEAVTNRYYHQAQELNGMLGGDDKNFNASWPAYGQLASNSAGSVLRDDGVPIFNTISDDVAKGNRKVFADIAPRYDSFIEESKKPGFDMDKWADKEFGPRPEGVPSLLEASKDPNFDLDKYKESLKTAKDENGNPTEYEGAYLRESFDYLNAAINEKDPDKKQELLLGSNVLAGRHEQQKLQPDIAAATAPISGGDSELERAVLEGAVDKDPKLYLPNGSGSGPMDEYKVDQKLEGTPAEALKEITDPSTRAALSIGLGGNRVPGSIKGEDLIANTGTENWADLDGRMETIIGLMTATQNSSNTGEYVLDYDQPQGLSTTGNIADVGRNFVEKSGEIFDATTDTLGDLTTGLVEKGTSILGGLF